MNADSTPAPVLVIGGGGLSGIAWALGLLVGLGPALPSSQRWSRIIGTSAGATVGAEYVTGHIEAAFESQFRHSTEIPVDVALDDYRRDLIRLIAGAKSAGEARARIGRFAIEQTSVSPETRRAVIAARLPAHEWPAIDQLTITAVDAHVGSLVELTCGSGVALVDAVNASCAVPGVWPVVTIAGQTLIDGGIRSTCNADLGPVEGRRIVVVPSQLDDRSRSRLDRELAKRPAMVVTLDERSRDAVGPNPFDPARRGAAATAGHRQGERERAGIVRYLQG